MLKLPNAEELSRTHRSLVPRLVSRVVQRLRHLGSPFIVTLSTVIALLGLQWVSFFAVGWLFLSGPVPIRLGECGYPLLANSTSTSTTLPPILSPQLTSYDVTLQQHFLPLFERAANTFTLCTDSGDNITCPGPIDGTTFTWDVFQGQGCWFGEANCVTPNGETILQRATITPQSMGTTRNSRLALTYVMECSHIDVPLLTQNTTLGGEEIYVFNFGSTLSLVQSELSNPLLPTAVEPEFQSLAKAFPNSTWIVYDAEKFSRAYLTEFVTYPIPGADYSYKTIWNPAQFLTAQLNSSTPNSSIAGAQILTIVGNRISGVTSLEPNDDPFFLTETNLRYGPQIPIYFPNGILGALACRDKLHLHVRPTAANPATFSASDIIATGRIEELYHGLLNYTTSSGNTTFTRGLWSDFWLLAIPSAFPLTYQAMVGLAGNILGAAETVVGGIQQAPSMNVSTRGEVTRWFGTVVLNALNTALMVTSGVENNWGYGIGRLPPESEAAGEEHWVCTGTLRDSTTYTSVNFWWLVAVLVLCGTVIAVSWALVWAVELYGKQGTSRLAEKWREKVLATTLYAPLQLHRIAIEMLHGTSFRNTDGDFPVPEMNRDTKFAGNGALLFQSSFTTKVDEEKELIPAPPETTVRHDTNRNDESIIAPTQPENGGSHKTETNFSTRPKPEGDSSENSSTAIDHETHHSAIKTSPELRATQRHSPSVTETQIPLLDKRQQPHGARFNTL